MSIPRILIAEDDAILAAHLEEILIHLGYQVTALTATGSGAVKAALAQIPDAILMDIRLRGEMTGIQAADKIHKKTDIPVIFLTTDTDEELLQKVRVADAYAYLAKPVGDRELRASLEIALHKHSTEMHVRHLNQVLRAVLDVNQLITCEHNPQRLMEEACRILVLTRGYVLVWIGQPEKKDKRVLPIARAGKQTEYLDGIHITWDDSAHGKSPTGRAVRTHKPVISRDIATDPKYAAWRAAALERGFASSAAIPILHEKRLLGVLNVYADSANSFDEEEVDLLVEMTGDLGFALKRLEDEQERKRTEKALQESQTKYQQIVDLAVEGIWTTDKHFRVTFVNARMATLLGYPPKELIGQTVDNFLFPEDLKAHRQKMRLRKVDLADTYERRYRRKDGSEIWLLVSSTPYFDEAGQFNGTFALFTDITDRKRMEESIRMGEEKFRTFIEQSTDGITLIDEQGNIIEWNQARVLGTGLKREEVIGKPYWDVQGIVTTPEHRTPERLRGMKTMILDALRTGKSSLFEKTIDAVVSTPKGERRTIQQILFPIKTDLGYRIGSLSRDVTERKKGEATLREINTRLNALVEQVPAIVYTESADVERKTLFISLQLEVLTGYSPADWVEDHHFWIKAIHPNDQARIVAEDERTTKTGEPFRVEYRLITRDGRTLWIRNEALLIRDEYGQPVFWQGIMHDITERKQAEESLRQNTEQYRMLAENMTDTVWLMDLNFRTTYISPSVTKLRGYSLEELNTMPLGQQMSPESFTGVMEVFSTELTPERIARRDLPIIKTIELEFYRKDGSSIWSENTFSLIRDAEGQPLAILGTGRDITEQRKAQVALQNSEKRFRALIEKSTDAIILMDSRGIILYESPAYGRISGRDPTQRVGRNVFDYIHPKDQPVLAQALNRIIRHPGESTKSIYRARYEDGSWRWVEATATNLLGESAIQSIVVNLHDITEHIQAEVAIQRQLTELEVLYESGLSISRLLEPKEIAGKMIEILLQKLQWHNAAIRLLDPKTDQVKLLALSQPDLDPNQIQAEIDRLNKIVTRSGKSVSGWVIKHHKTIRSGDLRKEKNYLPTYPDIRSGIYVPILIGDRAIGSIAVESRKENRFSEEDERLLITLAAQSAIAFENARLYHEALHAAERRVILHRASQEITTAGLDLEAVYAAIHRATAELMLTEAFFISIYDRSRNETESVFLIDKGKRYPNLRRAIGDGIAGRVIQTRTSLLSKDVSKEKSIKIITFGDGDSRSILAVPMFSGTTVMGAISAQSYQPSVYDEEDLALLEMLAAYAGTAIENARLFEAERKQRQMSDALRNALDAGASLSESLDFDTVLDRLLEALETVIPFDGAAITLVDRLNGRANIAKTRGYEHYGADVAAEVTKISFDIRTVANLRWMDENKQPLVIPDVSKYPGWVKLESNIVRSYAGAPIVIDDEVIAFFSLNKDEANFYTEEHAEMLKAFTGQASLALQNSRLFEQTRRRAEELGALAGVSAALRTASTRTEMLPIILDQVMALFRVAGAALVFNNPETGDNVVALGRGKLAGDTGMIIPAGKGATSQVFRTGKPYLSQATGQDKIFYQPPSGVVLRAMALVPLIAQEEPIGVLCAGREEAISEEEVKLLVSIADIAANAIQRATSFEQIARYAEQLVHINAIGRALSELLDLPQIYERLSRSALELLPDSATVYISLYDPEEKLITATYGLQDGEVLDVSRLPKIPLSPPGEGTQSEAIRTAKPLIVRDLNAKFSWAGIPSVAVGTSGPSTQSGIYVPMIVHGKVIGAVQMQSYRLNRYTLEDAEFLSLVANTAAIAIENARLFTETQLRLHRLSALHSIDATISASVDTHVTLSILLEHVMTELKADAVAVLLFNTRTLMLEYAAGRGFRSHIVDGIRLRLGEGFAGRAALQRRAISIADLQQANLSDPGMEQTGAGSAQAPLQYLDGENFAAYHAIPLIAKGQIQGVLEIFHRTPMQTDQEWNTFFEMLAGQAAIAIDNGRLFESLQQSNIELTLAYDATIKGWSQALELRDEETEGHTQRVTDLTLRLIQAMDVNEAEMEHARRGALLHDIGKIAIPDSILLKPGPLDEREWVVMRQHTQYAYELLSQVDYLRLALPIPYCHHEKWDGSGYPRGLKGEEIPMVARIFAIVDVYDALTSNRPYRQAWTADKTLEYIREQSGKHFDPTVVNAFLELMSGEN